ncbi:AbrB/MazE/SpoVT family DNA-binding domain-containing protein [Myxosarcina sp. GI1(2024)]
MNSQIGQWGNSLTVRLPKHISQSLGLKVNDRLSITEDNGRIILEPIEELEELSLDELLSQVIEPPEPEVDWGKPEGDEIW